MVAKTNTQESAGESDSKDNNQAPFVFELGAEIGIADAKALFTDLGVLLKEQAELMIDASQVESVDTAVLQLLVVAVRDHANLSWKNPSETFCKTAGLLGLAEHLGLESGSDNNKT